MTGAIGRPPRSPTADRLDERLGGEIERIVARASDTVWSICVRDADGEPCAVHGADTVLPTASVGKVLLLLETARRIEESAAFGDVPLRRDAVEPVGEAGLWQRLRVATLPLADVACLVATVSDNLATNVLLDRVGLPAVRALAGSLGLQDSALLDRIRSLRGAGDPPHLSVGTATEWSDVMARIDRGVLVSPAASRRVRDWLAGNADLSMVAVPFGFDPLAHPATDRRSLFNKTGSDPGTRADIGCVRFGDRRASYAVIARWQDDDEEALDRVLSCMQGIGTAIRTFVESAGADPANV